MNALAPIDRVRRLGAQLKTAVRDEPPHALTLKLTLILVVLSGAGSSAVEMPVRILATLMLVFPALLQQPMLWWLLTASLAMGNLRDWYLIENHKHLITYWVLACTLSLHMRERQAWLGSMARVMTALLFGFAVLGKLIGGEFLNGSVLYYTLLTDSRLAGLSTAVTGISLDELSIIPSAVDFLGTQGSVGIPLMLPRVPSLFFVALVFSWSTVAIEGAVALIHATGGARLYLLRHFSLMMFVALTYFLFPVAGFASILLLMGLAQCQHHDAGMRFRYLLMLAVMQLTLIRWEGLDTSVS